MSSPEIPHVFDTPDYSATPCLDCDVPGYLILQPHQESATVAELDAQAKADLGPVLGMLEQAIREVTVAEHVYVVRFSEGLGSVHFHLFPRSRKLAELWTSSEPEAAKSGINGPLLFAWARIKYHVSSPTDLSPNTLAIATQIAAKLHSIQTVPTPLIPSNANQS